MSTEKTQHYRDGEHYEQRETTHPDGSKTIVESKVTDSPLGRVGSNIVSETRVDSHGNSVTKNR